jgi:hypothetical protein
MGPAHVRRCGDHLPRRFWRSATQPVWLRVAHFFRFSTGSRLQEMASEIKATAKTIGLTIRVADVWNNIAERSPMWQSIVDPSKPI